MGITNLIVVMVSLYIHPTITLYTLNLHNVMCQLYLNKAEKKIFKTEVILLNCLMFHLKLKIKKLYILSAVCFSSYLRYLL